MGQRRNVENGLKKTILICTRSCIQKVGLRRATFIFKLFAVVQTHGRILLVDLAIEAIAATLSTLSVDAQKRAAKDAQKKEAKAAAAEARAAESKAQAQVLIKRVERNKRKFVTAVSGLEAHGMDLKKVAKEWGKKFATGSSVTKTASGGEEVVVQGDNSDEIFDWVVDVAGVPEDNVECIEDKKKK